MQVFGQPILKFQFHVPFCFILYFSFRSRSSFSCNRVRTNTLTKWVVKEFDNVLVPEKDQGIFYTNEAYVLRWAYQITVVRELEGLTPGSGPFAQDRKYRKRLQEQKEGKIPNGEKSVKKKKEDSDSECSDVESDEEYRRVLESGGRDRCAYFFWQGMCRHVILVCGHMTEYSLGASLLSCSPLSCLSFPLISVLDLPLSS